MNTFFMPATTMLAMTEGAGGLFDFNATLPLMAIQFILLTVVLTFIFYKPVAKVIDDRETYINGNLTQASDKLIKADELYKQYDEQLKTARVNAQSVIAKYFLVVAYNCSFEPLSLTPPREDAQSK